MYIDPDFGWHVRLGELTSKYGIFATDPFSYTMPSFPFIDHEWLTNIFIFKTLNLLGKASLGIIFTLLAIASIILSLKRNKFPKSFSNKTFVLIDTLLFVVAAGLLQPFFGIRPQVESWLLYSIFLFFLTNEKRLEKYLYLTPFFVFFWTNIHGSFPLPIVSLFIIVVFKSVRERKIWFRGFITIVLSVIATCINPYGFRAWHEVYQQVTDTSVRWILLEWKPAIFSFNLFYLIFVCIFIITFKNLFSNYKLEYAILNVFMFLQGLSSVRHVPLWLIVMLPIARDSIINFYSQSKKIYLGTVRFKKALNGSLVVVSLIYLAMLFLQNYPPNTGLNEKYFYPQKAIEFLKEINPQGNVFSNYEWGGYLIWKYPEKKVFIDGRMATWKWQANMPEESNYIMGDYVDFIKGKRDFDDEFKKYNIHTVLWPNTHVKSILYSMELYMRKVILKREVKGELDVNRLMIDRGWEVIYKDNVATIYQK